MNISHLHNLDNQLSINADSITDFDNCGILILDKHARIRMFDHCATSLFGYEMADVSGLTAEFLLIEKCRDHFREFCHHLLTATQESINPLFTVGRHKNGSAFPLSMQFKTASIDNTSMTIVVLSDARIKYQLAHHLRKLTTALDLSPCSTMITDVNGVIDYVNPAFTEVSGYNYDEILGKKPNILKSGIHPPAFYAEIWETLLAGKTWKGVISNRSKTGDIYNEYVCISPLRNINDNISHFIAIKLDESESKHQEKDFTAYVSELKRSNDVLKEFAFFASHGLQEPLRKILAFADLLHSNENSLNEHSLNYLNRLQISARRMQVLIDDLMAYSLVSNTPKHLVEVDLNEIIGYVIKEIESCSNPAEFKVKILTLPKIQADKKQMKRLFSNLISNSVKYRREDKPVEIVFNSRLDQAKWEIVMEDNGIGFDIKHHNNIFQPFKRLHAQNCYKGTGMGLFICKRIVEMHGGDITATSEVNMGSKFIIHLPERQNN